MFIRAFVIAVFAAFIVGTADAYDEDFYNTDFCWSVGGVDESRSIPGSRIDCETDEIVYEADWASFKMFEGIGQSLYYSSMTGKTPGLLLIIKDDHGPKHVAKAKIIIDTWDLPIVLEVMDIRNQ